MMQEGVPAKRSRPNNDVHGEAGATFSLHINVRSDPPVYYFTDGSENRADLPAGQESQLQTLLISEEEWKKEATFPLDGLDASKKYEFERLELKGIVKELKSVFPPCVSTDFREINLKDVTVEEESEDFFRSLVISKKLKKLIMHDLTHDCDLIMKRFYWKTNQWESFVWVDQEPYDSDQVDEFGPGEIISFIETWKDQEDPIMKYFEIGTYADSIYYDLRDELAEWYGDKNTDLLEWIVPHSNGKLAAHVSLHGSFVMEVKEMDDVAEIPDRNLERMSKRDLIDTVKELQKRLKAAQRSL
ncbi:hypothetical protein QR680_018599 [Steinernema hermaphroditum]|uniref:Uncharacterized protein n=1 Tax=Steinernema hermaphroditum TaxID=289476 RepID=A0AA39HJE9_9BILA|nr:hypothetical protein QR680_018599 [Steinernema hermaphroditum]